MVKAFSRQGRRFGQLVIHSVGKIDQAQLFTLLGIDGTLGLLFISSQILHSGFEEASCAITTIGICGSRLLLVQWPFIEAVTVEMVPAPVMEYREFDSMHLGMDGNHFNVTAFSLTVIGEHRLG